MSEHLFDLFRLELLADIAPEYLIKDAIFDYANTYGSHSGTYVPKKIHFFRRIETADKNMGLDLIKNVTEIAIATTDYLVNYIDKTIKV